MKKPVNNIEADKATVAQIKSGSSREKESAFSALYNRYYNTMLFHVLRMVKNDREVAEDLVQEIFSKAFLRIGQYDGTHAFSTWLFKIASNHIVDNKRSSKSNEVLSLESLKTSSDDGEDTTERLFQLADTSLSANVVEAMNRRDRISAAREAINAIKSDKHKLVLITCEIEELSYKEASAKLEMPIGTIKALLFRGREEVKKFLMEKNFDTSPYKRLSTQTLAKQDEELVETEMMAIA